MNTLNNLQSSQNVLQYITDFIVPIIVAILIYLAVDKLGELKKRRDYSRLGVAIIESLQEEVKNGINLMTTALEAADDKDFDRLPKASLPNRSWDGMTTIPDEVLLRIITTSAKGKFDDLPPRECRIHCKNYFEMMNQNYNQTLALSVNLFNERRVWSPVIQSLLADEEGHYIKAAQNVYQMLENAKKLLEKNSNSWFPK